MTWQLIIQFILGLFLGILISLLSWRVGALTKSGAWAAAVTGGLIFGLGGLAWAVLLLTFFISSSALSRYYARRKESLGEKFAKSSQRDHGQVLANGGLGALLALGLIIWPEHEWLWLAYSGAMAAVNADTWATELGVLSPVAPRLITSGRRVERGSSGAISLYGTLAALAGAGLIGIITAAFDPQHGYFSTVLGITLAGVAGAMFDPTLGASIQAIYYCPSCQKETERYPRHSCGTETIRQRGWRWMNNDWVNFFCSLVGALVAAGILA
jgi:uncharacterized protein (TIGR00297 family)